MTVTVQQLMLTGWAIAGFPHLVGPGAGPGVADPRAVVVMVARGWQALGAQVSVYDAGAAGFEVVAVGADGIAVFAVGVGGSDMSART